MPHAKFKTFLQAVINYCYSFLLVYRAKVRKQRSLRALEQLDDHLLDDAGFYRAIDGRILPLEKTQQRQSGALFEKSKVEAVSLPKFIALRQTENPNRTELTHVRKRLLLHLRRR